VTKAAVDPRVERSRRAILEATLAELGEVGYGAMTIESVAARAGVGKATVYRHWSGKLDLIESALDELKHDIVVPDVGTSRERIVVFLRGLAAHIGDSTLAACLPALVSASEYDPAVAEFKRRFSQSRRQQLVDLVEAGVAAGEICSDRDAAFVAELLVSPIFFRRLISQEPLGAEHVEAVVDAVLG
jgi:TetR/AcrR family transcriptional regulator of autoinduction and epiphytic fitness